ncbi:DUF1127 domain-containing protein [Marivita sp. S0852]|uniref:DUF1127 domain-containing protein n=1 Tax=Marivita sp. S0852 TaxID=3373893 RepID=UPI0039819CB9
MLTLNRTGFGHAPAKTAKGSILARFNTAMALRRSRKCLATLDPHLLSDVGLSQQDAKTEASRPVWDAPSVWKR